MESAGRDLSRANGWDDILDDADYDKVSVYGEEDDFVDVDDGLAEDIFEEAGTPSLDLTKTLDRQSSYTPVYGIKVDENETDMGGDSGGLIYYAKILKNGYKNKYICTKDGNLKARRPIPQVYQDDFFKSLTKTKEGNWVFNGRLNGWPAITRLELLSLEYHYTKKVAGQTAKLSKRFWRKSPGNKNDPVYPKPGYGFFKVEPKSIRAKLRAPAWSEVGYSKDNPGFVWHFARFREGGARVARKYST